MDINRTELICRKSQTKLTNLQSDLNMGVRNLPTKKDPESNRSKDEIPQDKNKTSKPTKELKELKLTLLKSLQNTKAETLYRTISLIPKPGQITKEENHSPTPLMDMTANGQQSTGELSLKHI